MPQVRIKICGITTPEDARMASDAGADAIGLNFSPQSPRFVTPTQATAIVRVLPAFTAPVGVFVGVPIRQVCAIAYQLGLRAVQSYNDDSPDEDPFPFAHIPAFRVKDLGGLERIRQFIDQTTPSGRPPAAILIDSHIEGQMGGTGTAAPWHLLRGFDPGVPVILAGGLTPDNVAEAIQVVNPWAVDVASGVEIAPGRKDPEKLRRFVKITQSASSHRESV